MRRFFLPFLLAITLLIAQRGFTDSCTACDSHCKHSTNSLSPVVRLTMSPQILSENFGFSLLGEFGAKNYRGGLTLGTEFDTSSTLNLLKISGEYLSQKLEYGFHSGSLHRWVNQYAVGGEYQLLIPKCLQFSSWVYSVDFNITYSHANSRHINSVECPLDTIRNQTPLLFRHIAGGSNTHGDIGTTLAPWQNGQLFLGLDYDYTSFHRKYQHDIRSSGFGGTIWLTQTLGRGFKFDIGAEFRRPFNFYSAEIAWQTPFNGGNLSLGAFVNYTNGHERLPNSSVAGISIDFAFGQAASYPRSYYSAGFVPTCCPCICDSHLIAWLARPAVYMPTVLAIADQQYQYTSPSESSCPTCQICTDCCLIDSNPFIVGQTSDQPWNFAELGNFNATPNFFGDDLVYSISPAISGLSIDQTTGIVSYSGTSFLSQLFTISAQNACGNTSQTIYFENID